MSLELVNSAAGLLEAAVLSVAVAGAKTHLGLVVLQVQQLLGVESSASFTERGGEREGWNTVCY